ncbi:hypothetical protein BCR32DRAFT_270977 [Anaeromyces robustus]|uniref:Uncharacterized protein n=1 Tax=Anaeromyces robustus TaxID=1754192 RepID=A0A1Y1WUC8_9FUNG|nr:hypothetical protein BCR32DRAFT_270977 [Anaeromyces robustus]|eukprot:ORX76908.1 hypothetical protein BCR32DRAFT_270977 [Anaeromyces robustus]
MNHIKVCQMNTKFENLIYDKFWTKEVEEEWKEMLQNKMNSNTYLRGFSGILYILGVYRNNYMKIGTKFPNGYVINHCPEIFLNSPIKTSHKHLLAFNNLEYNWNNFKRLRIFIFWAAKRKDITEYCHLTEPLDEPELKPKAESVIIQELKTNPENKNTNYLSSEERFKLLCEYTDRELPKMTFPIIFELMKKRNQAYFKKTKNLSLKDIKKENDYFENIENPFDINNSYLIPNNPNKSNFTIEIITRKNIIEDHISPIQYTNSEMSFKDNKIKEYIEISSDEESENVNKSNKNNLIEQKKRKIRQNDYSTSIGLKRKRENFKKNRKEEEEEENDDHTINIKLDEIYDTIKELKPGKLISITNDEDIKQNKKNNKKINDNNNINDNITFIDEYNNNNINRKKNISRHSKNQIKENLKYFEVLAYYYNKYFIKNCSDKRRRTSFIYSFRKTEEIYHKVFHIERFSDKNNKKKRLHYNNNNNNNNYNNNNKINNTTNNDINNIESNISNNLSETNKLKMKDEL